MRTTKNSKRALIPTFSIGSLPGRRPRSEAVPAAVNVRFPQIYRCPSFASLGDFFDLGQCREDDPATFPECTEPSRFRTKRIQVDSERYIVFFGRGRETVEGGLTSKDRALGLSRTKPLLA